MSGESAPDQQETPSEVARFQTVMLWVAAGVVALVIALCVAKNWPTSGDKPEIDAKIACQDWVKDQLKAPATADFSSVEISSDGDRYTVTGSVDSENTFGAKIRSRWTCVAHDDGDQFTRISVTVN